MEVESERVRLTFHELTRSTCVVCGASQTTPIEIPGSKSPRVPLCGACSARHYASRRAGIRTLGAALVAVLTAGAIVATLDPRSRQLAPFVAWLASAVVGIVAVRRIGDRQRALAPLLVLAVDEHRATYEIRRLRVTIGESAYRSVDSRPDSSVPRSPRAPGGSASWFAVPILAGGLLAGAAWHGANPVVLFDNPDGVVHTVRVDDTDFVIPEASHRMFRVHFGTRPFRIDGGEPFKLRLGWNADHVFAITGEGCYVDSLRTGFGSVTLNGASSSSARASHTYRGRWFEVPNARRTLPMTCRDR